MGEIGSEGFDNPSSRDEAMKNSFKPAEIIRPEEKPYDVMEEGRKAGLLRRFFARKAEKDLKAMEQEDQATPNKQTRSEKHKLKKEAKLAKKEASKERKEEKQKLKAVKKESFPVKEAQKILVEADAETQTIEAGRVLEEDGYNPVTEAENILTKETRELERREQPIDRSPELSTPPSEEIFNTENVLGEVLAKWGDNPEDIKKNLESAETKEIFADLVTIIKARKLDLMLRDEKFQDKKETQQLKAEVEAAYTALANPSLSNVRIDPDTGTHLIDITPKDKDGKISATEGREPGQLYYTFDATRAQNADKFTEMFKIDIKLLEKARIAAQSQAIGKPLNTDPELGHPDLDERVLPLNIFMAEMMETYKDAKTALKRPGKLRSKPNAEVVEKASTIADSLYTYFDTINKREIEWEADPSEKRVFEFA